MAYKDYKRIQLRDRKRRPEVKSVSKPSHIAPYIVMGVLLLAVVAGYTAYKKSDTPKSPTTETRTSDASSNLSSRQWRYIIIHHSSHDWGSAARYDSYHLKKYKNGGLLYHYVIGNGKGSADGQVESSERWLNQEPGGHVHESADEYNKWGIGICLVGDFEKHPPSKKQMKKLVALTRLLMARYKIPPENILTHKGVNATHCPGKHFPYKWFAETIGRNAGKTPVALGNYP
ncbi:MAG: N-acetylmuramoyl-L-alanine amidase [Spirochaetota bacterium]|nr:N-acetylmuramoyl-L-alanine amidase [Spirochaetota bacterium]